MVDCATDVKLSTSAQSTRCVGNNWLARYLFIFLSCVFPVVVLSLVDANTGEGGLPVPICVTLTSLSGSTIVSSTMSTTDVTGIY